MSAVRRTLASDDRPRLDAALTGDEHCREYNCISCDTRATQENVAVKDNTTAGKVTTDPMLTDDYLREHPLMTMPVAGLVTLGKVFYHSNVRTNLESIASANVS
jgi:hypothetical protein